ncbi:MAG: GerMN domain-containing protein [Mahellales bacterium]|jgi:hypothetical protein
MKKHRIAIILTTLIIIVLPACGRFNRLGNDMPKTRLQPDHGTPVPQDQSDEDSLNVSDFFPFEGDVYKKYTGEGNEYAQYQTYVDYIKNDAIQIRKINPGTEIVSVCTIEDGALKEVYYRGETYYRMDFTKSRNKDEIIIKEPIKPGTSWNLEGGSTRSITALQVDIEVPQGRHKALEVTTEGQYSIVKDYYVQGLGLVKSEFISKEDTATKVTSELEIMKKGAVAGQVIRLYYPDYNNDRILYVDKQVEVTTNTDMQDIFEQHLKTVPENSGLTPLLGPNVSIRGLSLDIEKSIVTIDFSPEIISEMNAGAGLESMILSSIANTFGDYYQAVGAVLTVVGKPYSSGHIALEQGEHINVDIENIQEYGQ